MAVKFGFYDSVNGDRKYNAADINNFLDGIVNDGVYPYKGSKFAVTASGNLSLSINTGRAWFNKSWISNEAPISLNLNSADVANPRIDAVVLEFNQASAIRTNSIKIITGTPASTPVKPTMVNNSSTGLYQYPLAYIAVAANATSITQANITSVVGTTECPYATSGLQTFVTDPVAMHRNTFRGKNLGTSYTTAQKLAVSSGTFDDIFIGDYWVIGGVTWRIADLDYYLNTGETTMLTTHHAVIVPDNWLYKLPWNDNNNDSIGYFNSKIFTPGMAQADTQSKAAFGTNSVLSYEQRFPTIASHGRAIQITTFKQTQMALMSEVQVYGSYIKSISPSEGLFSSRESFSTTQLALFRLAPQYRIANDPSPTQAGKDGYWLLDTETNGYACRVGGWGDATSRPMDSPCGVRPHFLID